MPENFAVDAEGSGDCVSATKELLKPRVEKFTKNATKKNFGGDSCSKELCDCAPTYCAGVVSRSCTQNHRSSKEAVRSCAGVVVRRSMRETGSAERAHRGSGRSERTQTDARVGESSSPDYPWSDRHGRPERDLRRRSR
jgi:hypothetical protein